MLFFRRPRRPDGVPLRASRHRRLLRRASFASAAALLLGWGPARAQESSSARGGLPPYASLNPIAVSRTPLRFEPYRTAWAGWQTELTLDYGSAVEWNPRDHAEYLLDAELLRAELTVARDVGGGMWAQAAVPLYAVHGGMLDGPIDWYHGMIGVDMPSRELRPANEYEYHIALPGAFVEVPSAGPFIGDVRLTVGRRHGSRLQTAVSLTLPTTTGPSPYGRGTPGLGVINTLRLPIGERSSYEGSVGVGWTGRAGALAAYQRRRFISVTSGLRVHVHGRHSLYANAIYHSPYYGGTGLPALDRRETSLDFGWIAASPDGSELRFGLVEDLEPSGAGIDVVLRAARRF